MEIKNKHIYIFFSFVFLIIFFVSLVRLYSGISVIIILLPTFFLILGSIIVTPMLLAKENYNFDTNLDNFYLIVSFWFLVNIIFFIWKW